MVSQMTQFGIAHGKRMVSLQRRQGASFASSGLLLDSSSAPLKRFTMSNAKLTKRSVGQITSYKDGRNKKDDIYAVLSYVAWRVEEYDVPLKA